MKVRVRISFDASAGKKGLCNVSHLREIEYNGPQDSAGTQLFLAEVDKLAVHTAARFLAHVGQHQASYPALYEPSKEPVIQPAERPMEEWIPQGGK